MISFRSDRSELPPPAEDKLSFSERSRAELREQVDTFHRAAELRTRLQNLYPYWQPTEAHRFVVGVMRDVGARLHPVALRECPFPGASSENDRLGHPSPAERSGIVHRLDQLYRRVASVWGGAEQSRLAGGELRSGAGLTRSVEEIALETRALILFERSLKNVARYLRTEAIEETVDGELRSVLCAPSSSRYQGEYLGSIWATQAALYAFRDNERLLGETFQVMRRNLPDMLVIFSDEAGFNQLMGTMQIIARRSETFSRALLSQRWLKLSEADLGGATESPSSQTDI